MAKVNSVNARAMIWSVKLQKQGSKSECSKKLSKICRLLYP